METLTERRQERRSEGDLAQGMPREKDIRHHKRIKNRKKLGKYKFAKTMMNSMKGSTQLKARTTE